MPVSTAALHLDIVSPLPPVRSGISDYTVDLVPLLADRAAGRVRLVRLPGAPAPELPDTVRQRVEVIGVERLGEDGRVPVYQMGNNHHHLEIWRLATGDAPPGGPGVLVLHDLVLHHFLIERTVAADDFEGYRRQLAADHGWIGAAAAMPFRWPGGAGNAAQFSLPAHRSLLAGQRGVLVHSHWAADVLAEEIPGLPVRVVPMGVPLPARADAAAGAAFRAAHGLPADRPVLGSFGFQTPMKRTEQVIRALAEPELRDLGVHLMVAGEVAAILELDRVAADVDVSDRVHVLGFLPWDQFEGAIAACDLALNLRYPTAGETSASLLRILAAGRPAVVSDHAQMAELPDDVVVKVPVGAGERRMLAERLSALLADRDRLDELGAAARRHVAEHHRPEDAAAAVLDACATFLDAETPAEIGPPPPAPPSSLAWDRLEGDVEVEGAAAPWPPGERRRLRVVLRNRSEAVWRAAERPAGGIAVQTRLWVRESGAGEDAARDLWADRPWLGLPLDLEPGAAHTFELSLRRPLDRWVRLQILPHVLDHAGLPDLGGPSWEAAL